MLIVRNNERKAMRAVFTADRDRLFGGQHRGRHSSQGLAPSIGRGS